MRLTCTLGAVALLATSAQADIITQWNFNSVTPDATTGTGSDAPSIGSGVLSLQGGTTGTFATGGVTGVAPASGSDPAGLLVGPGQPDNSGENTTNYPAASAASGTAGIRFDVSTVGVTDVIVSWDQRFSNTSSRYYQFQYTLDGSAMAPVWVAGTTFDNTVGGDSWINGNTVDLSAIDAVEGLANFAFRIVAVFGPGGSYVASRSTSTYGGAGTWRFDMVTLSATVPTPGTAALAGLGMLAAGRRRR